MFISITFCTILNKLYTCQLIQLSGYILPILKVPPKLIPAGMAIAKNNFQSIAASKNSRIDVLNGIAYNPKTKTYFVTGKNWDKTFEIVVE